MFGAVDRVVEAGHDPRRFAADLLQRLRDLMLIQAVPDAAQRGLVDAAEDELERMVEQAERLGPATLARYGEILHAGLVEMRGATAPRLLLELLCARMLLPAASTAEAALLERLERMERRASIAPAPVPHGETRGGASARRRMRRSRRRRGGRSSGAPARARRRRRPTGRSPLGRLGPPADADAPAVARPARPRRPRARGAAADRRVPGTRGEAQRR